MAFPAYKFMNIPDEPARVVTSESRRTISTEPTMSNGQLLNFVGGTWVRSSASEYLDVINPATAQAMTTVPLSPGAEVDHAVQKASAALKRNRQNRDIRPSLERHAGFNGQRSHPIGQRPCLWQHCLYLYQQMVAPRL